MPIYEKYSAGRLTERVLVVLGGYDDIHTYGTRVLERQEAGDRDGWYADGEWGAAEAARLKVADETVKGVLAEVGDDPGKARVALDAELSQPAPRKSLVAALMRVAGPEPQSTTDTTEEG